MKFSEEDLKRLGWHSRRGMLELDLLLVPFASKHLQELTQEQLELYRDLLQEEDQDLFSWFIRRTLAPSERLQVMVDLVLSKNVPEASSKASS